MNLLKQKIAYFLGVAMTVAALSACSDDETLLPAFTDENATTELVTIVIPPEETIFFDFKTNSIQESAQSMVSLSGMYGSSLSNTQEDVYKMGYFDLEDFSIDDLLLADILQQDLTMTDAFTIDLTATPFPDPNNTDPTWVIYDFHNGHAVIPTPNRYIVMYKGTTLDARAEELYIFKGEAIEAAEGTATYNIRVKTFSRN